MTNLNTTILIADDDPFQRLVIKAALSEEGYIVIEAENGAEAVALFAEHLPELVILDVEMPIMKGYEACEKIRQLPTGLLTGIVIATGLEDNTSINEAYRSGATDFIVKPFNWVIIQQRIKYILRSVRNVGKVNQLLADKVESEKKLWQLAYYDTLTHLPNRAFVNKQIKDNILTYPNSPFSIFLINVNKFKLLNDTYGSKFGDLLLQNVTGRIQGYLHNIKNNLVEHQFLARFSGSEFVLLCGFEQTEDQISIAETLLSMLTAPIFLEQREVYLSASIGVSTFSKDGMDSETLLKHASVALFSAKKEGANKFLFFDPKMNADRIPNLDFENKLRKAFDQNEFVLYYQPQYCFKTDKLVGAEALVRWIHPEMGMVSPVAFISKLEELGLINQLGESVLRMGFQALKSWLAVDLSIESLSINLASSQFEEPNFPTLIVDLLKEFTLDPRKINIEITESMFVNQSDVTLKNLKLLHDLNMLISIDDFGVGYSSLSYLTAFPVDHLKIDKEFINNMTRSQSDHNLVKAIIQMAHALELKVVAEGIETAEQRDLLKALQCDYAQGYYYSKPLPEAEFIKLLESCSHPSFLPSIPNSTC